MPFLRLAWVRDARPAWFVFAVDLESLEIVAAKRLEPDEKGLEIFITDVEPEPAPVPAPT